MFILHGATLASMVSARMMGMGPLVRLMVWPARPEAKVMVCPASKAPSTAARKLPPPLSLVLVTMMGPQPCGAAGAAATSAWASTRQATVSR
jgi:hypothetical protein